MGNRVDMADYMVLTAIFLGALYWALESLLNVFSPEEISFYQEIFGPNISDVWPRLIVFCLFLMFGSHVQFTINERNRALEALKESEEKYRTILENIEEGYYEIDFEGYFIFGNDSLSKILGVPKVDLRFMNFWEFMDEKNAGLIYETFLECRRSGRPVKAFDCQFNIEGATLFIEASASLLQDSKGLPIGYRGVLRDRTEKKKMEMDLLESYRKVHEARSATILGLAKLAEYRDEGTGTHLERIREYARILAVQLAKNPNFADRIDKQYIDDIYQSSILHDIGKVGTPDALLLKPGELTEDEFDIIKRHTLMGGNALKAIESQIEGKSFLAMGKEIAYNHHEKWDGSGYPRGLKGEEIPLSARIIAVADVYDALTTKRFYKEAYSHEKAKSMIIRLKGQHFDPEIVNAFVAIEAQLNRVRKEKLREETAFTRQRVRAVGH
ncbi:MAG: PAS domain S-box protein, partial [Deltaproteobacteria bacterium]|jgi:PAS domain S-box-containing protein|nr:PAS domain S-box protein [Deltaproteobacteria bacterium]